MFLLVITESELLAHEVVCQRQGHLGMDLETGTGLDQRILFVLQQLNLSVPGCTQDFPGD